MDTNSSNLPFTTSTNSTDSYASLGQSSLSGQILGQQTSGRNVLIFVADGLRYGSVNPTDAPTLSQIRQDGVNFTNSHSLFPTFTTPNASAIATGHYLGDTGDFSNTVYSGFPTPSAGGSPTPFIENDAVIGDLNAKYRGSYDASDPDSFSYYNFLNEDTLLQYARQHGYNTAAVGKLGPTLLQDPSQGSRDPVTGAVPAAQTIVIDDSTGKTGGIPLNPDITQRLVTSGVGATAPDRSNGTPTGNPLNNGNSGNNTTPGTQTANYVQQQYFTDAVTKAILPTFAQDGKPFAMVYWSRDPDGTQHNQGDSLNSLTPGINGPTSKAGIKNADNNLAQIIQSLKDQGLYDNTDIFITSDHGFSTISKQATDTQGGKVNDYASSQTYPKVNPGFLPPGFVAIDIAHELGLNLFDPDQATKASDGTYSYKQIDPTQGQRPNNGNGLLTDSSTLSTPDANTAPPAKVIVAANGGSDLIYVPDKKPETVKKIVEFLSKQDYTSGLFVDDALGNIPGTLPLSSINLKGSSQLPTPTIVLNFKTFATNPRDPVNSEVEIADTGLQQGQGMHGSFGRGDTFNNMAAIGPDFKQGYTDSAPVSNADVATTLASILGFTIPSNGNLTGRTVSEALKGGPDQVDYSRGVEKSDPASNGQSTYLSYQKVGDTKYFDAAGYDGRTVGLQTVATKLDARAVLPADTFAVGPTSGQFLTLNNDGSTTPANTNGRTTPFQGPNGQPVQGFSAVLPGPKAGTYLAMIDNGYGTKANSSDSLLRVYGVEPDFQTGKVYPINVKTGERLDSFNSDSFIQLNDKNGVLKGRQTIVADLDTYPGSDKIQSGGIPVDPTIKQGRLLTGSDFDTESFRQVSDGTYWFGEEFGPYLLHVDANGTLLEPPVPTPNTLKLGDNPQVQSPDNPDFTSFSEADKVKAADLPRSKGFEGMALSADGSKLYTLLEGPLTTDPERNRLQINVFDLKTEQYTGQTYSYKLDAPFPNRAIGDMTAINDHEFLVLERDNGQGDASNPAFTNPALSKKLYKIDLNQVDSDGFVHKELVADLLNISDPNNVGGNGTKNGVFTFPFNTIEDIVPVDPQTVLLIDDNNYPFSSGRTPGQPDANEFIKLHLDRPLDLTIPYTTSQMASGSLGSPGTLQSPPKVVVISLDGATPRLVNQYLQSGVLKSDRGLGLLASKGLSAEQNLTITPSLTAPGHTAIATGSTAANNDINANSFHLVASPFTFNISGFAAPIGGYSVGIDGASETSQSTANPVWRNLLQAGKKVVAATFPGADGADIKVPGLSNSPIVQPASERTVSYTVPFGEFGGVGTQGFTLTTADFSTAPSSTTDQLTAAGKFSYSPVLQKTTPLDQFTVGGVKYKIDVAALDTTNDSKVDYDTLVFFDENQGIKPGPFSLPSTGPAYVRASDGKSSPFYLEGSSNKAGTAFFVSDLAPDLSTVRIARYSANDIPRNPAVLNNVDDINNNVGFWANQADFRIPEKLSPGFNQFPDRELEAIYEDQVKGFVDYQTRVGLRAFSQTPNTDLGLIYIEQPDGSEHQFLITDPRQATNPQDPNSIGAGQDKTKIARYQKYVESAYQAADQAVQRVIQAVGTDANGVPKSDIIVVSDHGFDPFFTTVNINSYLKSQGFDPTKVRAITSGPAVNIYFNLQGREPNGTVSREEYITLQKQVTEALKKLADTNPNYTNGAANVPVFDQVYDRPLPANINDPSFGLGTSDFIGQDSGDVFALLTEGYNFDGQQTPVVQRLGDSPSNSPVLSVPNFYGAHGYDPTLPNMSAIFYAAGPDFGKGTLPQVQNIDIAPTVDKLLGVQPASTVQGKPIDTLAK